MKAGFSQRFIPQYAALSSQRKAKFDKQLGFLLANLRYPSLRAKKHDEARDIWQARLDDDYGSTSRSRVTRTEFSQWSPTRSRRSVCPLSFPSLPFVLLPSPTLRISEYQYGVARM